MGLRKSSRPSRGSGSAPRSRGSNVGQSVPGVVSPDSSFKRRGSAFRGRHRGRGRGGRSGRGKVTRENLDADLDKYMMKDPVVAKSRLDDELNAYMMDVEPTSAQPAVVSLTDTAI
jgi:C-terminal duplication domain of Friend of PRMT1